MNSFAVQIAENLRIHRERCGYSQKQVAAALNIDRSTYAYYELGKTTPSIQTILQLSKLFNVDFTELLASEKNSTELHDSNRDPLRLNAEELQLLFSFRLLTDEQRHQLLASMPKDLLSDPNCAAWKNIFE